MARLAIATIFCALAVSAFAQGRHTPIDTNLCEILDHPSQYVGKTVRVRVQNAVDLYGIAVLTQPLVPEFIATASMYNHECKLGFDFETAVPKGWLAGMGLSAFEGPFPRQFTIVKFGPIATVIGRVIRRSQVAPKPLVVRNAKGEIIETHFWNPEPPSFEPDLRIVIKGIEE